MKAGIVDSVTEAEEEQSSDELHEESLSPALHLDSWVNRRALRASVAPSGMHGKVRVPGRVDGPALVSGGVHSPLEVTDEAQEAVVASDESL